MLLHGEHEGASVQASELPPPSQTLLQDAPAQTPPLETEDAQTQTLQQDNQESSATGGDWSDGRVRQWNQDVLRTTPMSQTPPKYNPEHVPEPMTPPTPPQDNATAVTQARTGSYRSFQHRRLR